MSTEKSIKKRCIAQRFFIRARCLAVLSDLIADDTAYGCAAHRTQDPASGDDGASDTAQACAGNGAFLAMAHAVPRGTTTQSQGKDSDGGQFTESC